MLYGLRVLWTFMKVGLLDELAYRANLAIQILQSALALAAAVAGLLLVFSHTDSLGGWGPNEMLTVMGIHLLVGGALGVVIQPSMRRLIVDVREGTLDYTLTKPADAQFLVSVSQLQVWRLVDVGIGIAVVVVAITRQTASGEIGLSPDTLAGEISGGAFVVALLAGGAIVYSFYLMMASLSFWFLRIENILVIFEFTYQTGRWPIGIFPGWLRFVLTFLIPIAFAITVPAEALVGRITPGRLASAVTVALLLLAVSRLVWRAGLRHYSGASA